MIPTKEESLIRRLWRPKKVKEVTQSNQNRRRKKMIKWIFLGIAATLSGIHGLLAETTILVALNLLYGFCMVAFGVTLAQE